MHLSTYIVDAFCTGAFTGNPAAVVPLSAWLPDDFMQKIAAQNNLSETVFVGPVDGVAKLSEEAARGSADADAGIRWFTPQSEVDLCGHATLAAAHAMFRHRLHPSTLITFASRSGPLSITLEPERHMTLDFPSRPPAPVAEPEGLAEALGATPIETHAARDLIVVLESAEQVRDLSPDMDQLATVDGFAICVTAAGDVERSEDEPKADFVSRFFVPREGIPEDPVTGSAHCSLAPFWAERLGRTELIARQLSTRGGVLDCTMAGDRVMLGGNARTYLEGAITVPAPPSMLVEPEDPRAARRRARAERAAAAKS